MQKESLKFSDSLIFEGMVSIRAIIAGIDSGINSRRIEKIIYSKDRTKKIYKELGYLKAVSKQYGFVVEESDDETIESLCVGNSHGGLLCICSDRSYNSVDELSEVDRSGFYALIEGIEDPYNFGYAIRSLYAAGCDGIILSERNWMSAAGVVCRASAGASERIKIYSGEVGRALENLALLNYKIVCAQEDGREELFSADLSKPICLVVGGERRGVSNKVLDLATSTVAIPYGREFRASLSAASAATIFAYEILRQSK